MQSYSEPSSYPGAQPSPSSDEFSPHMAGPGPLGFGGRRAVGGTLVSDSYLPPGFPSSHREAEEFYYNRNKEVEGVVRGLGPTQTGFGAAAQGSGYSVQYLSEGLLNQWLLQRSPMSTFSQFDQDPYPNHYSTGSPQIRQQAFQPLVGPSQTQLQLQHQVGVSQPSYPPRQYLPQHFQPSASSTSYPSPHTYHQLYHSGAQCDPHGANPLTSPAYGSSYSYQPPAPKPCYDQSKGSLGSPGLRYAPPAKPALLGSQIASFCSAETPGKSPLHFHPAFSPGSNPSPAASRAQSPCCSSSPSPLLPAGEGLPCGLGRNRLLGSMPRSSPTLTGQYGGDRRASDSLTALSSQVANITPGLPNLLGPHRRTARRPAKDNLPLAPDPGPLAERPGLSPDSDRPFSSQAAGRLPGLSSPSSPSNQEPTGRLCHDGPLGRASDIGHRTFGARDGEQGLGLGLGGYPIVRDKDMCLPQQTSPSFAPKARLITHNGGCTLPQAPRLLTSPLNRPVDSVKPPNFLNYSFPNCGPQPRPPSDSPGPPLSGPLPSGPHPPSPHPSGPYPTSSYTQPRSDLGPKAAQTPSLLQAALQAGFPARKSRCSYIPEPQYSRDCPLEFSGQEPGREDANGAGLPEVPDWLLNDHGATQVDSDPQAGTERKTVICDVFPAQRVTPQGLEPGYQLLSSGETRPGECARVGPSVCVVAGECVRTGFGEIERAVASESRSTGHGGCMSGEFVGDTNLSASLEAEAKDSAGSPAHPRFDPLELKACSKMASTPLHAGLVGDFSQHAPRSRGTRARRAGGRSAARRRAASRSRGSENPDTFSQFNSAHLIGLHRMDRDISGPCQRPVSSETLALMLSKQPNVQPSCVQNEEGVRTQVWGKSSHQWNQTVEGRRAAGGPGRNLGVEPEANGWTWSKPMCCGDLCPQETKPCSLTAVPQQGIDDLSPTTITEGNGTTRTEDVQWSRATGVLWDEGPRSDGPEEPLLPPLIISRRRIRPFISPIPSKRQCPEQPYTQPNPSPFPTPEDAHREIEKKTNPDGDLSPTSPLAKALPPRKGRGSKLEAIVQKISSPNGRKFPPMGVGDGTSEGVTLDDILLAKEVMWPGQDVCEEHGFLGDNAIQKGKRHQRSHQAELLASSQGPGSSSLSSLTRWTSQSQHSPLSLVPPSPNTESSGLHSPDRSSGKGYFPSGKKRGRPLGSINKPKRQQERAAEGELLEEMSQNKKPGKKTDPRPRRRRKTLPKDPIVTPMELVIKQEASPAPRAQRRMFSPYVRLEQKSPEHVLCSIFNTEEEERRGRVTTLASGPANKSFPTSSHVVLGPLVTEASTLGPLVCSLCGKFPNHRNLGDLFGPYYPQEYASTLPRNPPARRVLPPQARVKVRHKSMPELVCPAPSGESRVAEGLDGPHRLRRRHHSEEGGPTWVSPRLSNPAQKPRYQWCELRTQNPKAEPLSQVELDLPHLPLDPNELWLHGPCVVWASGVYLLNGHLYGLQEALHMAREMKCSHCQELGATLGCYCKGCSLRYHYVCAVQAGCFMNEENLSIKCPKHKHRALKVIITDQSERG